MNKYKLKMKTPTGLGNEYVYVYATSNFERYLNKHNLKYARDITKDYQLTDRFEKLQQKVNQLETNRDEAIRYINKLVFEDYGVMYDNGTSIMEYEDSCQETLLEILGRGKE